MKWVVLAARILVGMGLTFTGASYFFMAPPAMTDLPPAADHFFAAFGPTHWMDVVKVCELLGGLLLLSGRLTPLGVVLAMPVAVNILAWDVCVLHKPFGPGIILVGLLAVVMFGYRNYFSPFFRPTAKMV